MRALLPERSVLRVRGADAAGFLQNILTNDITVADKGALVYACLLNPQGRFLHDMFVARAAGGDGFLLECEAARRDDLLRRLKMFRLRSDVTLEDVFGEYDVIVADGAEGFADPRHADLPRRMYIKNSGVRPSPAYRDRRMALGIPEGSDGIAPEKDTLAHVNFDRIGAVSWTKGCYVGQEVTAMTQNRGEAKRRMAIVSGKDLTVGEDLGGGEIRAVNSSGDIGLAVLKMADMGGPLVRTNGATATARQPDWAAFGF